MKKIILIAFTLAFSFASGFCGDRQIAFERDQAVWIAKFDGTGEKRIADGIFPAISPDGTRVAFSDNCLVLSGLRMENSSRFQSWQTRRGTLGW